MSSYPQITTSAVLPGVNDHTYDVGFYRSAVVGMGNYTWIDADKDGIQDASEKPLAGVTVTLFNPDGTPAKNLAGGAATATTDSKGYYFIDNLAPGSYYAKFVLPANYVFTTKSSSGSTSGNDSNPDVATGITPVFTIGSSVAGDTVADSDSSTLATFVDPTIDAGVVPRGSVSVGNFVWRDRNGDGIRDLPTAASGRRAHAAQRGRDTRDRHLGPRGEAAGHEEGRQVPLQGPPAGQVRGVHRLPHELLADHEGPTRPRAQLVVLQSHVAEPECR